MRVYSACRCTEDGEITAPGKWIQSPSHAPESHAVHAARRAPRCRTHCHPVTSQSAASPASAGTGSGRAGSQGQPEYDQHGSPREVSLPSFLSRFVSPCQERREGDRKRSLSRDSPEAALPSQRETFSLTSSPRFTSRGQVVSDKMVIEARREAHVDEGRSSWKSYRSVLRFQLCACFRANRRLIRKLDLSVLNASRRFLCPARPKEYDFKRIERDSEAVEIRELLTPLDLFRFLSPRYLP